MVETVPRDALLEELRRLRRPGVRLQLLPEEDVEVLSGYLKALEVAAGETLIRFGEESLRCYLILSGHLEVANGTSIQNAEVLNEAEAGDFLGEVALLAGGEQMIEARAKEPARLAVLDHGGLLEILEKHPKTWQRLAAMAQNKMLWGRLGTHLDRIFGPFGENRNEALEELETNVGWRSLRAGEVLFEEGEAGDDAYILLSGRLRVAVKTESGGRQIISDLGAGELVGEIALLAGRPRTATVFAARDCELAQLSRQSFDRMTEQSRAAMVQVSRILVDRLVEQQSGHQRPASFESVALVPIDPDVDVQPFAEGLAGCLGRHGSTGLITRESIDSTLRMKGIADVPEGDPPHLRLVRWLHEQEQENDHLLFLADTEWTSWTRRCIRQSDHLVFVARAESAPEVGALERELVDPSQHVSLVLLHDPATDRPRHTDRWLEHRSVGAVYHLRSGDQKHLERLARTLTGRAVGVVLGGGGGKGFAHLGLLRALEGLGVPVDMIGGTSMGAPIAHLPAQGFDAEEAHEIIRAGFRGLLDYTLPLVSVLAGKRINRVIEQHALDWLIEDLWLPYFCVSTNITTAQPMIHRRGNLARAVRASVAIPGVLPPVPLGDELLVDGGVLNNLPIDVMRAMNPSGTVIAVDVVPRQGPTATEHFGYSQSGWDVLAGRFLPWKKRVGAPPLVATVLRSMVVGADRVRRKMVDEEMADLYLNIDISGVGMLQFDAVDEVAGMGYNQTYPALERWLESGGLKRSMSAS